MRMVRNTGFLGVLAFFWPGAIEADAWRQTGDVLRIQQGDPWPEVYYLNHGGENSREGVYPLEWQGIVVDVEIVVTATYETIIVRPRDEMVRVEPSEADVDDGDDVTIQIIPPLF